MAFFGKKTISDEASQQSPDRERLDNYLNLVRALIILIKEHSFDFKELEPDKFKAQMKDLSEYINHDRALSKIDQTFEKYKDIILKYIKATKEYVLEREKEFRDIIEIMSKGMAEVNEENRAFNDRIFESSDSIEKLTYLDDIRKIKGELIKHVDEVRKVVKEKQKKDEVLIKEMSAKVEALQENLKEAEDASMKDALTGALNRLAFDRIMENLSDRFNVSKKVFSLLMFDIDNFKSINDNYGHQIGDRVLMALVQHCNNHIRKEDVLARYGGEEFAFILPGATLKHAVKRANVIRKKIEEAKYSIGSKDSKNAQLSFTVSIGVSCIREGDSVSSVIKRADDCLYMAKKTGKNKVIAENDM